MNARETLEKAVKVARGDIQKYWASLSKRDRDIAELGVRRVIAAGFTIMSKEDVDSIRDQALEEAASIANGWHPHNFTCQKVATAIRALKSGGNNGE